MSLPLADKLSLNAYFSVNPHLFRFPIPATLQMKVVTEENHISRRLHKENNTSDSS
jgi:hypothetical protein